MKEKKIKTPEDLVKWRLRHGLSQGKVAYFFGRSRRMIQYLEAGEKLGTKDGTLPKYIIELAHLYDLTHKRR